jgi:hypothetical protein
MSALFQELGQSPLPVLEMLGIASPEFAGTTPQQYLARGTAIELAKLTQAAVAHGTESEQPLPPTHAGAVTTLQLLQESCATGRFQKPWDPTLHVLAVATLPYLDSSAAQQLLDAAVPDACADALSDSARSWLELYRAVAARDAAWMASVAERLLAAGATRDASRRQYLSTAAMLGRLVAGQPKQALEFWEKHRVEDDTAQPPGDMRLLVSMAIGRQQDSAPGAARAP